MNYNKIYFDLILDARLYPAEASYKENHHIHPKAMGGSNNKENMVKLSAKQHYIAHFLLYKIYNNRSMAEAWRMMTYGKKRYCSRTFALARETAYKKRVGIKRSDETKRKIGLKSKGRIPNDETKRKIGEASKKLIRNVEHCKKISDSLKAKDWKPIKKVCVESNTNKSIEQYTKDGVFLKKWISQTEAASELKVSKSGISACCKGNQKSSHGFIWIFSKNNINKTTKTQ